MSDARQNSHHGKKVCMLSSVHSAFDVRIYEKEAKSLVEAGYDVAIVAPDGKNGKSDAVEIVRVRRQDNRLQRMTRGIWEVYRKAKEIDAEVYHFHDPELIPVGLLLKICGKQVIYDVHEDVPRDILAKTWISPILRKPAATGAGLVHFLSALLFDRIIAATPVIASRFPSNKVLTVQNFPRLEQSDKIPPSYADRGPFVAYIGGISRQRGAQEMIQAMSMLRGFPDARLLLAGEFEKFDLERELRGLPGFERVDYRGWLTRIEVRDLLSISKSGLVLLHPFQMYMEAQPIKLFEYMAAGIPVIASDFPLWRAIVGETGCGLLVDPQNPRDIARAIEWILGHPEEAEQMGQRGAAAVRSKYNWEAESEKLLKLYSNLMNGRKDHSLRHTAVTE
jgi:glycosyltransferase involved in cell wall biosynthesis